MKLTVPWPYACIWSQPSMDPELPYCVCTTVRMSLMDSANWKYDPPVDCMSIVCGAIVMMRLAPTRIAASAAPGP